MLQIYIKLSKVNLLGFQATVYDICLRTCDDGMDGSEVFPEYPQVIADKYVLVVATL